mmetsp:Transcript_49655/g.123434  ORF Transcript_49655/g.123434 Transcript_49655/m.123434 type:complete len:233 (+) Transcript_49655:376-1074(+)
MLRTCADGVPAKARYSSPEEQVRNKSAPAGTSMPNSGRSALVNASCAGPAARPNKSTTSSRSIGAVHWSKSDCRIRTSARTSKKPACFNSPGGEPANGESVLALAEPGAMYSAATLARPTLPPPTKLCRMPWILISSGKSMPSTIPPPAACVRRRWSSTAATRHSTPTRAHDVINGVLDGALARVSCTGSGSRYGSVAGLYSGSGLPNLESPSKWRRSGGGAGGSHASGSIS